MSDPLPSAKAQIILDSVVDLLNPTEIPQIGVTVRRLIMIAYSVGYAEGKLSGAQFIADGLRRGD